MRLYLKKELEELEKLIKLAGEGGVADNSVEENREERAGGLYNLWAKAESQNDGTLFPSMKAALETETETEVVSISS